MKRLFLSSITFFLCLFCLSKVVFAATYSFAVIGDVTTTPEIKNFYEMFDRQKISYKKLLPSQVIDGTVFNDVDAIISFVDINGPIPNPTAVVNFANNNIVISHGYDFANYYYPQYSSSYVKIWTWIVNYSMDWGNFRKDDEIEFQRSDHTLWVFLTSALVSNPDVTKIAEYRNTHVALFHMKGLTDKSGFYVMDLNATTNETEWSGIWHIFPAVKMVKDFPTGKYSTWFGNGTKWWTLDWVNNYMDELVNENSDIASKMVLSRKTVQGRDINAIVIGNGNRYAIIDGCIHGNEKVGAFSALRTAELLIEYYRSNSYWQTKLNQYKVIIVPVLNPDGFAANTRQNANGKDLNRQFPPGGPTTEPEAWALRELVDDKKPVIYFTFHEAGAKYPAHLIYGVYQAQPLMKYTIFSLNGFTRNDFKSLKHWGYFNESGVKAWIGDVNWIGQGSTEGSYNGMSIHYVSKYHNASSVLMESFIWSDSVGSRKSLWGLDFYTSIPIGHLKHYDYDGDFLYISNSFITSNTIGTDTLTLTLDTTGLTGNSTIVIRDMKDKGEPTEVTIDGIKMDEGDKWNYYSDSKNITVKNATNSILINWGEVLTTTTTTTIKPIPPTSTTTTSTTTTTTSTTTSITSTTSSTTSTIPYGLVGFWKFDENSGSTAVDSSGYGNNGIISGATWTNGVSNSALRFDGLNDYVNITDSNNLDTTNAITIETWIYPTSWPSYAPRIVSKEYSTAARPYALELIDSIKAVGICLNISTTEVCVNAPTNSIEPNKWSHVAGTWDGTVAKIYVNGQLKNSGALTGTMAITDNNVLIGNNPSKNRQFNGTIDEVKIWNKALTEGEIIYAYETSKPTTTSTTISTSTSLTTTTAPCLPRLSGCTPGGTPECCGTCIRGVCQSGGGGGGRMPLMMDLINIIRGFIEKISGLKS